MSTRANRTSPWRRIALATVATTGLALTTLAGAPVQAASSGWVSEAKSYIPANFGDKGGADAYSNLLLDGTLRYSVVFRAWGEELYLKDNYTDGRRAQAEVRVYRHNGPNGPYDLVDRDINLFTGTWHWFNIGTPDGTGDIPEGYWVAIRVRPEGTSNWSDWAYGRA